MQLVKYSPQINELMQKDHEAVYLFTGWIRINNTTNYQIPYIAIVKSFSFWNCIQITKLIKLLLKNRNLFQLSTNYTIYNVKYKFILFVKGIFSLDVYPFKGMYQLSQFNPPTIQNKLIKTSVGSCWKAFESDKNITFRLDLGKQDLKSQYNLTISLFGAGLFEGTIQIKLKPHPYQEPQLQILLWDQTQIQQGYTMYKESKLQTNKTQKMIVINESNISNYNL